jgi:hypothetical protein
MKDLLQEKNKQKNLFKIKDYCVSCQQRKSCGLLEREKKYCCACYQELLEELEKDGLLISSAQQVLNDYRRDIISCQCLKTEKPRVKYISSDGSGWISCEGAKCERIISSAGHHRTIRNRNDPKFWGLETKEKVLCLGCLGNLVEKMEANKKYVFNKYRKRRYI